MNQKFLDGTGDDNPIWAFFLSSNIGEKRDFTVL